MKPLTVEWVLKAEADYSTACRERRARKNPNHDAACFHAQQCIEKYLKARLQEADIRFGRTHDLVALLDQTTPIEPSWESLREDLRALSAFATEFRYPGRSADRETAADAVKRMRKVRRIIRKSLNPN